MYKQPSVRAEYDNTNDTSHRLLCWCWAHVSGLLEECWDTHYLPSQYSGGKPAKFEFPQLMIKQLESKFILHEIERESKRKKL